MKPIFYCTKKKYQVDEDICIARQNKKMCKCTKGKEVLAAKVISRKRTRT